MSEHLVPKILTARLSLSIAEIHLHSAAHPPETQLEALLYAPKSRTLQSARSTTSIRPFQPQRLHIPVLKSKKAKTTTKMAI